jgi:glucokinase
MNQNLLGIEIGGTKLQLAVGDERAAIVKRVRQPVDPKQDGADIRRQIAEAVAELKKEFFFAAVGVGYGGPVDWKSGVVCCSHHVEGWNDFPLGDWLRELTGVPVSVDNDANVAALGEAFHGAGKGASPVFYTNSGTGVGGGLVVDMRIYHGAKPGEAEFGHLRLDRSGTIVEDRCSGRAVDAKIRAATLKEHNSVLAKLTADSDQGEASALGPALREGDALARRIVEETAQDLAFALSHVVHLFHPEVIVLGGGLALIGEPWRAAVEMALPQHIMRAFHPPPPVRLAALGEDIVPVGALELAAGCLRRKMSATS